MDNLIATLFTSTAVSAVVSYLFRIWFESRMKHHFDRELEMIKAQLAVASEAAREITNRKMKAYPYLIELVYRLRNLAREIVDSPASPLSLQNELKARVNELEDNLYAFRMDLEQDNAFLLLHVYKNALKTFLQYLDDWQFYNSKSDSDVGDSSQKIFQLLQAQYEEIEKIYTSAVKNLSAIVSESVELTIANR